ncbi:MAG: hypothetical protein WD063_16155 [Pirellulales bacterium]
MAGPRNASEESASQGAPEKLVAAMEQEMQQYLQSVMQTVNNAPDGAWIAGSEESVRDLSADFRRRVFERAVQMRVDAAEAAFPPSAQPGDGQASGE